MMADIENLNINVTVDIQQALRKINELGDELEDLADKLSRVDARGADGVDVDTDLHDTQTQAELAALETQVMTLDGSEINLHTDVERSGSLNDLFGIEDEQTRLIPDTPRDANIFQPPDVTPSPAVVHSGRSGGIDVSAAAQRADFVDLRNVSPSQLRQTINAFSDGMDESIGQMTEFDLRMSDLHNLMARLVPLLVVFLGTIPAIMGAFVTLAAAAVSAAAALAAITGFGALGLALEDGQFNMDNLTQAFEDLRDSFIEAFAPLAEQLQPLFEEALTGLERLFQTIASQSDALLGLTDEARAFGGFIMDMVPTVLRVMAGLAEAFAPIFGDIGNFIEDNLLNIVRTMVEVTMEALPALSELAFLIGNFLPALVRLSVGFTQAANAVLQVINGLSGLLGILPVSTEFIGLLIGSVLSLITAMALLNTQTIANLASSLINLHLVVARNIGRLWGYVAATRAAAGSTALLGSVVSGVLNLVGVGILMKGLSIAAQALGFAFSSTAAEIDNATQSLKDFDSTASKVGGTGGDVNPYGISARSGVSASPTVINIESTGDSQEDTSNVQYASFRQGRTTGGTN
jgi:hypothetical protein